MIQRTDDPLVKKAPLLFSSAQSQYLSPPEFTQHKQKTEKEMDETAIFKFCFFKKGQREGQKCLNIKQGKAAKKWHTTQVYLHS